MQAFTRSCRWWLSHAVLLAIGGCVTHQQPVDFTRTEVARVIADSVGRTLQILAQATL